MNTIELIHNEIDTAADRLLAEAKAIIGETSTSKAERLHKLGFVETSEVKKMKITVKTRELATLIEHYQQEYPFQKFLTVEELDRICKKYNLIYAPVSRYLESVPEKNLRDIENAPRLKYQDEQSSVLWYRFFGSVKGLTSEERKIAKKGFEINGEYRRSGNQEILEKYFGKRVNPTYETLYQTMENLDRRGLFIAAPRTHFDLKGLKNVGLGFLNFKPLPKDPIVFRYVKGGVQVLTKWGLEANDPALLNSKDN